MNVNKLKKKAKTADNLGKASAFLLNVDNNKKEREIVQVEETQFTVNKDTVHELESLLDNDYKEFDVWLSASFDTIKIKSITNPSLPILVIGLLNSQ